MIDLPARTRRISGTRLLDLCRERGIASLADPFMGVPTHLNVLKRHGIAVHGGDLLEWFVRAGEGLVVNDFTILRDSEVAELVEMIPGRIYPTDLFRAWEGVFFSEEQARYLGVWHANVHALRSDGQTGLAVLGLWHVLCHWLLKAQHPDEMVDVPPSELAWPWLGSSLFAAAGLLVSLGIRRDPKEISRAYATAAQDAEPAAPVSVPSSRPPPNPLEYILSYSTSCASGSTRAANADDCTAPT